MQLNIHKSVKIPDPARMTLFQKCPELGNLVLIDGYLSYDLQLDPSGWFQFGECEPMSGEITG